MRTPESSRREERVSTGELRRAFRQDPIVMLLATGLGSGFSPFAPGTAGSAVALLAAAALVAALSPAPSHGPSIAPAVGLLMSGLAVALLAVPISTRASRALGRKDPGCIVLDEVAGQLLACSPIPLFLYPSRAAAGAAWLAAFLAFRFFDVVKPGAVRRLQALPEGLGIVADDVLAGLLAAGATCLAAWAAVYGGRLWS
jgi:phosphatidylglycerophosphatase A